MGSMTQRVIDGTPSDFIADDVLGIFSQDKIFGKIGVIIVDAGIQDGNRHPALRFDIIPRNRGVNRIQTPLLGGGGVIHPSLQFNPVRFERGRRLLNVIELKQVVGFRRCYERVVGKDIDHFIRILVALVRNPRQNLPVIERLRDKRHIRNVYTGIRKGFAQAAFIDATVEGYENLVRDAQLIAFGVKRDNRNLRARIAQTLFRTFDDCRFRKRPIRISGVLRKIGARRMRSARPHGNKSQSSRKKDSADERSPRPFENASPLLSMPRHSISAFPVASPATHEYRFSMKR